MSNQRILNILLIILAVIGAVAILSVLAMWLVHATMMGGMMGWLWEERCRLLGFRDSHRGCDRGDRCLTHSS